VSNEARILVKPHPDAVGPVGLPGEDPIPPEGKTISRDELDRYVPLLHSRRLVALPVPA
jgi:hypothetical protein